MEPAKSSDIVRFLEMLRLHAEITLVLKDGTEVSGIYEGLRGDQVLLADGREITFPREVALKQLSNVLLEFSSEPPE